MTEQPTAARTDLDLIAAVNELIDQGLTFGYAVHAFASRRTEEELAYVEAARSIYYEGGRIEVDEDALVSGSSDEGDYVLAWVWVTDDDVEERKT